MNNQDKDVNITKLGILVLTTIVAWGWMVIQVNAWKQFDCIKILHLNDLLSEKWSLVLRTKEEKMEYQEETTTSDFGLIIFVAVVIWFWIALS